MYIVSARKYRPDSFESLIGQDNIVRTLKNSIARGQLAHAYLFCGPRGVGKTSAARIFAKTINCSSPRGDMEPCGECESCRSFQEGRSYCIHELDAASNNSVEDIKSLIEQVNIPPQVGHYSVFIVDEVHMLSNQAFNAFLKTLEEPPAHAIFILATTEKHKILPTILSRCQTYDFNRIGIADMVSNLRSIADREGVSVDDESLHVIASKADGAMRDALTIFDQTVAFCGSEVRYEDVLGNLNVLSYEHCFDLTDCFLRGDYSSALLKFDGLLSRGFNALHFVSALSSHFRNLAVARSSALAALLEVPDSLRQRYAAQAARCSVRFIYDALSVTTACEAAYRSSVNPRLHVEFALMKLSFLLPAATESAPAAEPSGLSSAAPAQDAARSSRAAAQAARIPSAVPEAEAPSLSPAPESAAARPASPSPAASREESGRSAAETESAPGPESRAGRRRSAPKLVPAADTRVREDAPAVNAAKVPVTDVIPDDDAIKDAWHRLAQQYVDDRPRLYETLVSSRLEIEERKDCKLVTFRVANESQKRWVESKLLHELESGLISAAGSSRLRIAVDVRPLEDIVAKAYMPKEQATDLMSKNPEVMNLVKDFGLDA